MILEDPFQLRIWCDSVRNHLVPLWAPHIPHAWSSLLASQPALSSGWGELSTAVRAGSPSPPPPPKACGGPAPQLPSPWGKGIHTSVQTFPGVPILPRLHTPTQSPGLGGLQHPGLIFQVRVWTLFAAGLINHPPHKADVDQILPETYVWFNWSMERWLLGIFRENRHWTKGTQPHQSIFRGKVYHQNAAIEVKKKSHKNLKSWVENVQNKVIIIRKIALQSLKMNLNSKHVGKHGKSKIRGLCILNNKLQS